MQAVCLPGMLFTEGVMTSLIGTRVLPIVVIVPSELKLAEAGSPPTCMTTLALLAISSTTLSLSCRKIWSNETEYMPGKSRDSLALTSFNQNCWFHCTYQQHTHH